MKYSLRVRGKRSEWTFTFDGHPQYLAEWLEDGLDVVEITNTIPDWLPSWGYPVWVWLQDVGLIPL